MATDEQNQTAIDVATNPKVIALMKRYQESMKSVETQLPGEDQTNVAENMNQLLAGALDQIAELDEDDVEAMDPCSLNDM